MNEQDIFWNRAAETMSRDEYAKVQLDGLQRSLRRVWKNAFYRSRLQAGGVSSPEDVKSLDDLARLPFYTKELASGTRAARPRPRRRSCDASQA